MKYLFSIVSPLLIACGFLSSCDKQASQPSRPTNEIVEAARSQIGVTVEYNGAYEKISYPGGDIPRERGVCTDVVIRTLRDSMNLDLQKEVHEDMQSSFDTYPALWGLKAPDKNIDHRRVPNLRNYFSRMDWELPVTDDPDNYQPGDLVTCKVKSGRPHIMVVSNRLNEKGEPLVIHNLGRGTREENRLFHWELTGHYRVAETP